MFTLNYSGPVGFDLAQERRMDRGVKSPAGAVPRLSKDEAPHGPSGCGIDTDQHGPRIGRYL